MCRCAAARWKTHSGDTVEGTVFVPGNKEPRVALQTALRSESLVARCTMHPFSGHSGILRSRMTSAAVTPSPLLTCTILKNAILGIKQEEHAERKPKGLTAERLLKLSLQQRWIHGFSLTCPSRIFISYQVGSKNLHFIIQTSVLRKLVQIQSCKNGKRKLHWFNKKNIILSF